jgi:hypothetical protein
MSCQPGAGASRNSKEKRHDKEVIALVSGQNAENSLESDVNTGPDIAKLIQKGRTNAKRIDSDQPLGEV